MRLLKIYQTDFSQSPDHTLNGWKREHNIVMEVQSEINEFLTFLSLTPGQGARDGNAYKKWPCIEWGSYHPQLLLPAAN